MMCEKLQDPHDHWTKPRGTKTRNPRKEPPSKLYHQTCTVWEINFRKNHTHCPALIKPSCQVQNINDYKFKCPFGVVNHNRGSTNEYCECMNITNEKMKKNHPVYCTCTRNMAFTTIGYIGKDKCYENYLFTKKCVVLTATDITQTNRQTQQSYNVTKYEFNCSFVNCHNENYVQLYNVTGFNTTCVNGTSLAQSPTTTKKPPTTTTTTTTTTITTTASTTPSTTIMLTTTAGSTTALKPTTQTITSSSTHKSTTTSIYTKTNTTTKSTTLSRAPTMQVRSTAISLTATPTTTNNSTDKSTTASISTMASSTTTPRTSTSTTKTSSTTTTTSPTSTAIPTTKKSSTTASANLIPTLTPTTNRSSPTTTLVIVTNEKNVTFIPTLSTTIETSDSVSTIFEETSISDKSYSTNTSAYAINESIFTNNNLSKLELAPSYIEYSKQLNQGSLITFMLFATIVQLFVILGVGYSIKKRNERN